MKLSSLLKIASQVTEVAIKSPKPTDGIVSEFLRKRKNFGSKERRFLSENIFSTLRNFILLKHFADKFSRDNNIAGNEFFLMSACNCFLSANKKFEEFGSFDIFNRLNSTSESDFINLLINDISIEINVTISSVNDWLIATESFVKELDSNIKLHPDDWKNVELRYSFPQNLLVEIDKTSVDTFKYANKSIYPASVNLRVSTTISSKDEIELMLESMDISFEAGKLSPSSIILTERAKIDNTLEYKSGKFEIQDEGSQLIGFACNPNSTDKILDACAGAGGKSLHLADLTQGNSDIVAADVEFNRLRELKIRASRGGLNNISAIHIKAPDLASLKNTFSGTQFDLVLIDAPCSGMGTIRRDPMKKLRLTDRLLARLAEKQKRILSDYSNFVKPGGILVYATCSVMPQENQEVVDYFLQNNENFTPDPLKPHFESHGIELSDLGEHDFSYTTKTYVHNCDGFYMARMRKLY
ncbi:MAG: hypothetical protein CVV22_04115 [Ignavibacteriae bacterium HGW-Ignavibacteriae-1]|jgi:16S rRNA (cytosine967-C5)-methyltransferase|nr:MAG: hypothetical protein CVV22_04115 [Ignavibacteriae bacterium HGW-Ignavibacteriae-1]